MLFFKHAHTSRAPATSIVTRMQDYKTALEKRKGNHWRDKSAALDYAINALENQVPIDVITFETLFPNYAKATFSSKVNQLINEAIEESKQYLQRPKA